MLGFSGDNYCVEGDIDRGYGVEGCHIGVCCVEIFCRERDVVLEGTVLGCGVKN